LKGREASAHRPFIQKIIASLENIEKNDTPLYYAFVLILCWIFLRALLEGVFEIPKAIGFESFSYKNFVFHVIHFPFFYIAILIPLITVTSFVCKTKIEHTTRLFSAGLSVIVLVPILDVILSQGRGYLISYPANVFDLFINAFMPWLSKGSSWGQKIVLLLTCLGVSGYGYLKTRSIIRAVVLFAVTYCIVIFIGGFPLLLVHVIRGVPDGS
jgi:hypothetical protein